MKPKLKQTPKGKQVILNMNQQSFTREYPASFKELEELIESIWPKQLFHLQYEMNGKFIDLQDESDFQQADQDDQDLSLKLTPKLNSPSSSKQSVKYQPSLDFFDAFFNSDDFKCCNNQNCRACKGTGIFKLEMDQKVQINELVRKTVNKKFAKLKQIYKDKYNIKLEQERDFLTEHNKLISENKLPTLAQVQSQPTNQNIQLPISSFTSAPSPVPQQSYGFQQQSSFFSGIRTPKSSFVSQSQILTQSTGSQILKLSAQFKDLKIAPTFEPNTEAFFKVLLINNGVREWPQNVKLILTGKDAQSQTNISSLRSRESKQVKITFLTPKQPNNYTYQWRLCYEENGTQILFGPRFNTDFKVAFSGDKTKKFVNCIKNIWDKTDYDQIEKFVQEQLVQFPEIDEQSLINHYLDHQGGQII